LTKELCESCKLLPIDEHCVPVCRVCFHELPAGIDHSREPEELRFQKYLVEAMRLSCQSLTRLRVSEGLCPYINRTATSRRRAQNLKQEDRSYYESFKQECEADK
jgi:hypothetical protein